MCMCGATDCPSCGRAQGFIVVYTPGRGYANLETDDEVEAYDNGEYHHPRRGGLEPSEPDDE